MLMSCDIIGLMFTAVDIGLSAVDGLRRYIPVRKMALNSCIEWIISRQEQSGDWARIFPPMHLGILAYVLHGYKVHDAPVRRALQAIKRSSWRDSRGLRLQACVSPVWDTVLMAAAMSNAPKVDPEVVALRRKALDWVKNHQLLGSEGDWRVHRSKLTPGGFSFEYFNTWYADVDDTFAAVIALLKDDASSFASSAVLDAVKWVLGMQCHDGGWAAFDVDNDKLFLNQIPFSDMDSLCDPPTADIVGRVLEAFGLFLLRSSVSTKNDTIDGIVQSLAQSVIIACRKGILWLARQQERDGSLYGRWGVNYIYGTSNVLAGLSHFCSLDGRSALEEAYSDEGDPILSLVPAMTKRGLQFLLAAQQNDGGWGESTLSYQSSPANTSLRYHAEKDG